MKSIETTRIVLHFVCPNCKHRLTRSMIKSLIGYPQCFNCGSVGNRRYMVIEDMASIE